MRSIFLCLTGGGSMADLTGERDNDRDSLTDWMLVDQDDTAENGENQAEQQDEADEVDPDENEEEQNENEEEEEEEEDQTRKQDLITLGQKVEDVKGEADTESLASEASYLGYEERVRRRRNEKSEATQDEETDLSLASCPSLPDNLPAMKPDAQYVHTPDKEFNNRLNLIVALTLACVIGLGIGHFLGWSSRSLWEENLNAAQIVASMEKENENLNADIKRIQNLGLKPFKISGKDGKECRQLREEISVLINEIEEMRLTMGRLQLSKLPLASRDLKDVFNSLSKKNFDLRVAVAKLRHMNPELEDLKQSLKILKFEKEDIAYDYANLKYQQPIPQELSGIVRELEGLKQLVSEAAKKESPPPSVPYAKSYIAFMSQVFSSFNLFEDRFRGDFFSQLIPKNLKISAIVEGKVRIGKAKFHEIRHSLSTKWDQLKSLSQPENIAAAGISTLNKMNRVIVNVVNKLREIGQNTLIKRGRTPVEKTVTSLSDNLKALSDQFDTTWSALEGEVKLTKIEREKIFGTFLSEEIKEDEDVIEEEEIEEEEEEETNYIIKPKLDKISSKVAVDYIETPKEKPVHVKATVQEQPSSAPSPSHRTLERQKMKQASIKHVKEMKDDTVIHEKVPLQKEEERRKEKRKDEHKSQQAKSTELKKESNKATLIAKGLPKDVSHHPDYKEELDTHKINEMIREEMKDKLIEIKEAQTTRKKREEKEAKEKEKEDSRKKYEEHKRSKEPQKRRTTIQDNSKFYKGQYNKYKHVQFDGEEDSESREERMNYVRSKFQLHASDDDDDDDDDDDNDDDDDDDDDESSDKNNYKGLKRHWEKPQHKKSFFREHSGPKKQFIRRKGKGQKNSHKQKIHHPHSLYSPEKKKENESDSIALWDMKRGQARERYRRESARSGWLRRVYKFAKRHLSKNDPHHWWFDRAEERRILRHIRSGAFDYRQSAKNHWWFDRVEERGHLRNTRPDATDIHHQDAMTKDGITKEWQKMRFVRFTDTDDDDDDDDDDDEFDGDEFVDGKEDSFHSRGGGGRERKREKKREGRDWVVNQYDEVAKLQFG